MRLWHWHREPARFERRSEKNGGRCWPVFRRTVPERRPRRFLPFEFILYERCLQRRIRIEKAYRWCAYRPLTRHWFQIDEAIERTKGTLA